MNRRELRDHKYKLMSFVYNFADEEMDKLVDFYFENLPIEDEEEDENEYVGTISKYDYDKDIVSFTLKPDISEIKEFLIDLKIHLPVIDDMISNELKDWTIDRLPREEFNLLRLAVYEMYFAKNIDMNIAINEAILMSKVYGSSDKVTSFINGILSNLYKKNNDKLV